MPTQSNQLTSDQLALAQMLQSYGYYGSQLPTSSPGYVGGSNGNSMTGNIAASDYGASSILTGGAGGAVSNLVDGNYGAGILSLLSGGVSDLIGSFFGNDDDPPAWQPYVDAQGNYVWNNPTIANPVPLSNIPGASTAPTAEYNTMANQVRMVQDLLPYLSQAISAQKIPDAMGQLAADTATTGPRLALQQALQQQYGPIFDQLGIESNLRRSLGSAQNDLAVLQGPGSELVNQARQVAEQYDPEYFQTRATTADSLAKLLGQTTANLGTGLSATEADEVSRGLALSNARAGTTNAPSQLNTISNAMQFGAAGKARETQNQNQLSQAISASTAFLPQSRSNVDVFQVATGRPSYNQQDNRFNTNTANGDASGNANNLLNTGSSMWNTNANNQAAMSLQNDQQNDWGNRLGQITGALGSVGGLLMGACWIAREVYGLHNPRWLDFRAWLLMKSPTWFFNWYMKNGEKFAAWIAHKPILKRIIRVWMESRLAKKEDK